MRNRKIYQDTEDRTMFASEVQIAYRRSRPKNKIRITHAPDVADFAMKIYDYGIIGHREQAWAIYVNQNHEVLGFMKLSDGGISSAFVDARILFQGALLVNAVAMVLIHNHPSGSLAASREDERLTQTIKKAGDVMNIRLLDHVIVSPSGDYCSMKDDGLL